MKKNRRNKKVFPKGTAYVVAGLICCVILCIFLFLRHANGTSAIISNSSPATETTPIVSTQTLAPTPRPTPLPTPTPTPPSLPQSSLWKPVALSDMPGITAIEEAIIHPDTKSTVTALEMDMSKVQLNEVGGTEEPGGKLGVIGTGVIPASVQSSGSLVAAFGGGFQYRDGEYGMILNGTTYVPLKNNIATLVGYTDGTLKIINYTGQDLGTNVAFVRQNCPIILNNGVVNIVDESNVSVWGRLDTDAIATWRTGVGITANGNLIYAVGNPVTPTLLANALKTAGAVNGMQLDINPYWVRFTLFDKFSAGTYKPSIIMSGMYNAYHEFLTGYTKDFFYITKK